jgi:hypothetical protein
MVMLRVAFNKLISYSASLAEPVGEFLWFWQSS